MREGVADGPGHGVTFGARAVAEEAGGVADGEEPETGDRAALGAVGNFVDAPCFEPAIERDPGRIRGFDAIFDAGETPAVTGEGHRLLVGRVFDGEDSIGLLEVGGGIGLVVLVLVVAGMGGPVGEILAGARGERLEADADGGRGGTAVGFVGEGRLEAEGTGPSHDIPLPGGEGDGVAAFEEEAVAGDEGVVVNGAEALGREAEGDDAGAPAVDDGGVELAVRVGG